MSFSLCSIAASTMTATTRFKIPYITEMRAPTKMAAVYGCRWMTGRAICPQLSPANIVFRNVRLDCKTVLKASLQSLQSLQTPSSASSCTIGFRSSTATMDHSVVAIKQKRKDHAKVRITLANIIMSFRSSRSEGDFRMKRISRMMRAMRRSLKYRTSLTLPPPASRKMISVTEAKTMLMSTHQSKERSTCRPYTQAFARSSRK
mmetsp:Transcript_18382/g.43116  ORF Transcript_18382/g.43116 Transcript_18382/m.43116 type:complete len:204 (+) Transcript_18382:363-974(+)